MDEIKLLAKEFKLREEHVKNIITLIDGGSTIPFIARYRKEMTGECDDQVLRALDERLTYVRNLDKRKTEVLSSIRDQEKLTPELEAAINEAATLAVVEDLYRPYKPKRRTRATIAREKGLAPLADAIFLQQKMDLASAAEKFINVEKGVLSSEDALAGAHDIIAEMISDSADARAELRDAFHRSSALTAKAAKEEDSVYRQYYDFSESYRTLPSHRILACNRGEKDGFLKVGMAMDAISAKAALRRRFVKNVSETGRFVGECADDADVTLLQPSLERELRRELTDRASEQAISVFASNLRQLLLVPPIKGKTVLAIDPGMRTGCKIAVIDPTGKLLKTSIFYPTPPYNKTAESEAILFSLLKQYKVDAIACGNGTASKESEIFLAGALKKFGDPGLGYMMVSEAGASVYSASKLAAAEFPDFDVSLRSAVSIGRRMQDPLAELVKIDPKAIGVGQYQHDLPAARLSEALDGVVEDCVNAVGVDVNTASKELLARISGLNAASAAAIVKYRDEHGSFASREELKKVPRMGEKTFELCAGFLRVPHGENMLDNTGIHPESYEGCRRLLKVLGCDVSTETGRLALPLMLKNVGEAAAAEKAGLGLPTMRDIVKELLKPGRDLRDELPPPMLRRDIMDMSDLQPGMKIMGTVRNVTDFGAFVDIGVHQDGLVHVSRGADRFIRHPSEVLKVGDVMEFRVLSVDVAKKRIGLTLKKEEKAK
ncbi:MAG: RNA-binding transcriptional accessory protein [Clostridia bacterium]|nr:RNA-binding transcriptional accessory protein [Clostridia bacterium]